MQWKCLASHSCLNRTKEKTTQQILSKWLKWPYDVFRSCWRTIVLFVSLLPERIGYKGISRSMNLACRSLHLNVSRRPYDDQRKDSQLFPDHFIARMHARCCHSSTIFIITHNLYIISPLTTAVQSSRSFSGESAYHWIESTALFGIEQSNKTWFSLVRTFS